MTDEVDIYHGRARRRCRHCGVEIEIEKPTPVLSRASNPAWRKKARQEVARQICWEMLCRSCESWWNDTLRAIESGAPRATPTEMRIELPESPLEALNPYSPRAIAIRAARARERSACRETSAEERTAACERSEDRPKDAQ